MGFLILKPAQFRLLDDEKVISIISFGSGLHCCNGPKPAKALPVARPFAL